MVIANHFVVYSKPNCPYCEKAKHLITIQGDFFQEVLIDERTKEELLAKVPHARSVPQIFLEDEHIGGFTELDAFYTQRVKEFMGR